jgi:predicted RND superfamily exporter protein
MNNGFYSSKSLLSVPNALILLMVVFFLVPFAARGARMALQKTENNVKDWLPSDFRETEELAWFAKHFVSEQFIVATWDDCTEDSQRLKMFVAKLQNELEPDLTDQDNERSIVRATLRDYALFLGDDQFYNWGGLREKWLVDETGRHFYLTPNGRLYRWDGGANIVSAVGRLLQRAVGSFRLEGQFIAAVGPPGTDESPNRFWKDPRLIASPLFKTVETGPQVVQQLAGPGKSLFVESNPLAGERMAVARLTGTLFGPPVPADFSWLSKDLKNIIPVKTANALPAGWEEIWDQVIATAVEKQYGGEVERLRSADPVNQAEIWYQFFDAVGVEEPPRQTCVMLTLSEPARRNLARVLGRGVLGQPTGRIFQIAEECGVAAPPKPSMAPPPLNLLAKKPEVTGPLIRVGGPPVDNVAIDEEGTITLVRLIGYSLALGLFLSYFLLRSFRLMLMVFFVGGVSAMASLSMVWWGGASVDAILLTMPSLVYVLGIAGAIHIVNYYRDAVEQYGMANAPDHAIAHAVMPCTLAALTTSIGLFSLCSSNILPIRKFGIFSAMGIMATLALLYIYLPSALTIFPPKQKVLRGTGEALNKKMVLFWEYIGNWILKRHWYINVAFGLIFVALGLGLFKIQTSVQLLKLFDPGSQIIQDYRWLEDHFGRLVPMELVVRFPESMQTPSGDTSHLSTEELRQARTKLTLLERAEAVKRIQQVLQDQFGYEGENIVGRGMSAITFFRDMPEPSPTYSALRGGANNMLLSKRDELLQSDYLARETSTLAENAELWRISLRLGALNDVDYGQFVGSLRRAVEPIVAAYRCRKAVMDTVVAQEGQQIRGRVLFLGSNKPNVGKSNRITVDDPGRPRLPRESVVLADTLALCLVNNSITRMDWHDPVEYPLSETGKATSPKWRDYLRTYDCVVLVHAHADYDVDFIRANATQFVDATEMLGEIRLTNSIPRNAGGPPVEVSAHEGEMDVVYTGIIPVVYKAQRTLLESLVESVAWAFVLIFVVMACLLSPARSLLSSLSVRNASQALGCGAVSMIPNVFPVVIIFGLMGHMGTLVDIGTMMTASVAMGVAVDDTIHFLTWFRRGLRAGMDRKEAIFEAYRRVAPAMTQTTIIAGLGLSVFALSTFTPTQRFGTLMLTLLVAALFGDLIFLPALLASPLGKIFSVRPSQRGEQGEEEDFFGRSPGKGQDNQMIEEPSTSEHLSSSTQISSNIPTELASDELPTKAAVPPPKILRALGKNSGNQLRKRN